MTGPAPLPVEPDESGDDRDDIVDIDSRCLPDFAEWALLAILFFFILFGVGCVLVFVIFP